MSYPLYCTFVAGLALCAMTTRLLENDLGWALWYLGVALFCAYSAQDE
jgi:hypothetical protein